MDTVFVADKFKNEIVWKRTGSPGGCKRWGPIHDTILFYEASDNYFWNRVYQEYDPSYLDRYYRFEHERGRYRLVTLTGAGTRSWDSGQAWRDMDPNGSGRHWAVPNAALQASFPDANLRDLSTQQKLDLLDQAGLVYWPERGSVPQQNGTPRSQTVMRLPTLAYGKEFTHIPEHVRQDLETLDRECAVYADHWIEEVGDFRHIRIDFTAEERNEYFRRSWAYELFIRADSPTWAAETPGIDQDIANDADTYTMVLRDGTTILSPYHCFAAFLGSHLEMLTCSNSGREVVIQLHGREAKLFEVRRAIQTLTPTIRSFERREQGLGSWTITCEDDVRDLLFVMLRPVIFDITKEEAVPSKAGSHKFADLCSKAVPFLVELKWIGKRGTWKRKIGEIYVDIQTYARHPACQNLFFVIVDAVKDIPDPRQIEEELSGIQTIDNLEVNVRAFVCEP